jgi:hypothetical protein
LGGILFCIGFPWTWFSYRSGFCRKL